jgi:hypothetical protein
MFGILQRLARALPELTTAATGMLFRIEINRPNRVAPVDMYANFHGLLLQQRCFFFGDFLLALRACAATCRCGCGRVVLGCKRGLACRRFGRSCAASPACTRELAAFAFVFGLFERVVYVDVNVVLGHDQLIQL